MGNSLRSFGEGGKYRHQLVGEEGGEASEKRTTHWKAREGKASTLSSDRGEPNAVCLPGANNVSGLADGKKAGRSVTTAF